MQEENTNRATANLESEWENFEKMLAGGDDATAIETSNGADAEVKQTSITEPVAIPAVAAPETSSSSDTSHTLAAATAATSAATYNPYAYLSYLSADDKSDGM